MKERRRLEAGFFQRDPVTCARELIGAEFVWDGCRGRIVETEAYAAEGDAACHTFSRPSAREFVSQHDAGTAYVYLNYGMHWLFNVLVKGRGSEGFVLLRALEPLGGKDLMSLRRKRRPETDWCAGPAKLTVAMGIDGRHHGQTFLEDDHRAILWAESRADVVASPRIGISKATDLAWRFTENGSRFVSKRVSSR